MRPNLKVCLLFIFSFLLLLKVHGQQEEPKEFKWNIGCVAGISLPMSDFADKLDNNFKAGYAATGMAARLRASYHFNKSLFIAADYLWSYNPVDAASILERVVDNNPYGPQYKVTTYPWKISGVTAGIGTSFIMNDQFDIELKGMLGLVSGKYAKIVYQADEGNKITTITENADPTLELAINLGFELKYTITKKLGISFGGDYLNSEFNYNNVYQINSETGQKKSFGSYSQPVSVFQFSAGIFTKF
jgi:hypothetical protein